MPDTIFDLDALGAALGRLDLVEVARRTVEVAEVYMPGCAWLGANGVVHYAETLGEVEGLVLCQSTEQDPDDDSAIPFWVAAWVTDLGFPELAEQLSQHLGTRVWPT